MSKPIQNSDERWKKHNNNTMRYFNPKFKYIKHTNIQNNYQIRRSTTECDQLLQRALLLLLLGCTCTSRCRRRVQGVDALHPGIEALHIGVDALHACCNQAACIASTPRKYAVNECSFSAYSHFLSQPSSLTRYHSVLNSAGFRCVSYRI